MKEGSNERSNGQKEWREESNGQKEGRKEGK